MSRKWADYSFARPNLAQMKRDGIVGVIRYLAPDDQNTHGKIITLQEKNELLAAGFDIALNFEWYEGRCNEGYGSGTADAATALEQAKAIGYPQGKTIYFSHDTGSYDWQAIEAYFRAVRDRLGGYYKIGAYGSYELITHLHTAGLIDKGWQTLAWSYGQRDPWAVIYQNGTQLYDGQVDVDDVLSTDIGSWLDGPPGVTATEDDMFTDLDRSKLEQIFEQLPKLPLDLLTDQQNQQILADLDKRIAALQAQLNSLSVAGGALDYPTLAKAILDEEGRRLTSNG